MVDPISLTLGVVGLGMSLFGGIGQANAARQTSQLEQQKAAISENTASLEMQQNNVRQQAMELSGRRSQLETVRTAQRARAMAVQSGVSQGAQYGSGVAGGTAQTTGEEMYGLQGISQSLQSGRQMFGLDSSIDLNKIRIAMIGGQEAQISGNAATDAGIASLGGALLKAGPTIGNIFGGGNTSLNGGNGGFGIGSLFMGGFSPTGYGSGK